MFILFECILLKLCGCSMEKHGKPSLSKKRKISHRCHGQYFRKKQRKRTATNLYITKCFKGIRYFAFIRAMVERLVLYKHAVFQKISKMNAFVFRHDIVHKALGFCLVCAYRVK